ncbi:MAG: (2Fe-2S) ferredoxin domain-containing protein [Sporomusaceae bacterium]|nr:(2Fe-2S) ferredoxin domain-containing protein [Sporomusaceae bacterium]
MVRVEICIGSACHLRGANKVLQALKNLMEKHGIAHEVDVRGHFCEGRCTEGVILKINGELITNVRPDKVQQLFHEKILGGAK